jgi:hypothetical protein
MENPEARERYLKRQGMVEPVFSQLKCRQGLRRFRRKGLKAVRCEFALHAMAYMSSARQGKAQIFSKRSSCNPMSGNFQPILV